MKQSRQNGKTGNTRRRRHVKERQHKAKAPIPIPPYLETVSVRSPDPRDPFPSPPCQYRSLHQGSHGPAKVSEASRRASRGAESNPGETCRTSWSHRLYGLVPLGELGVRPYFSAVHVLGCMGHHSTPNRSKLAPQTLNLDLSCSKSKTRFFKRFELLESHGTKKDERKERREKKRKNKRKERSRRDSLFRPDTSA